MDVPDGAGTTLELRRVLSRCAPTLYRSTPLRRLHPFFDTLRTSLHQRTRAEGRAGRTVVLTADSDDPLRGFDHSWMANLLGAPIVSVGDLRTGSGTLTLRLPGLDSDPGDAVDAMLRLVPSAAAGSRWIWGPPRYGGVTGLVEAARCGDVEMLQPLRRRSAGEPGPAVRPAGSVPTDAPRGSPAEARRAGRRARELASAWTRTAATSWSNDRCGSRCW